METKKEKHTPGPWRYQEDSDAYTHIVRGPSNQFLVQMPQDTSGIAEADARLIAAAPDLLAACRLALSRESAQETVMGNGDKGLMAMLRAAIAKAEGR